MRYHDLVPKPRHPIRTEVRRGDRVLVYEVVHPGRWKYRDLLADFDARYGKAGAWVRAIDEVFDHAWLLEQKDVAHPVAKSMSWPYAITTRNIADVGDLVCAIRAARGGSDAVLRRLRIPEEFCGASFEGRVARFLVEAGLEFEFVRSTGDGKALDIRVGGARPFVIEVKSRQRAFRSRVEDSLTHLVWPHIAMALLGCHVVFDWSGLEVQAVKESQTETQLPEFARRAITTIHDALSRGGSDSVEIIELAGIGSVTIHRGVRDVDGAGAGTMSDPQRDVDRLAKTIAKAAPQLDPGLPGVVFLCVESDVLDKEPAPEAVVRFFGQRGHEFPHVSGAVVFVMTSAYAIVEETWPVPNPSASTELRALPLPEARQPMRRARWHLEDPFAIPDSAKRTGDG